MRLRLVAGANAVDGRPEDARRRADRDGEPDELEAAGGVHLLVLATDHDLLVVARRLDDLRDRRVGDVLGTGAGGRGRLLELGVERGRRSEDPRLNDD